MLAQVRISFCIIALATISCGDTPIEPDDLGTVITPMGEVDISMEPHFVWSPAGDEIFYFTSGTAGPPNVIKAVRVGDLTARIIDDEETGRRFLVISPDGEYLYYLLTRSQLVRRTTEPGGTLESIAVDVGSFRLSPDGTVLVHDSLADGQLTLYDVATGTSRSLGEGHPIVFSPDGASILCSTEPTARGGIASLFTLDLDTRMREDLTHTVPGLPRLVRWGDEGIVVLYQGSPVSELRLQNVTTREDTRLWMLDEDETIVNAMFSWSSDGTQVFTWSSRCVQSDGWDCMVSNHVLRAIHLSDGSERVVAHGTSPSPGLAVDSPAGDRVAFSLGGRIYVKSAAD